MIVNLHIGLHKTGTTTIQNTLDKARKLLAGNGWLYPSLPPGFANHSVAFFNAFSSASACKNYHHNVKREIQDIESERRGALASIIDTLDEAGKNVIFSGEDIPWIAMDGLRDLADLLRSRASDIRIIVYVRDPISYATSAALESLKYGVVLEEHAQRIPLPLFREKIEPFLQLFGKDNCRIRVFEKNPGHRLIDTFCECLDMPQQLMAQIAEAAPKNVAMSAEAAALLEAANASIPIIVDGQYNVARARNLSEVLTQIRGRPYRLSREALDYVVQAANEDVEWLAEVLGRHPFPRWRKQSLQTEGAKSALTADTLASIAVSLNEALIQSDLMRKERDHLLKEKKCGDKRLQD